MVGAVLSTVFDIGFVLALSLTLCFMALISLMLISGRGEDAEKLQISPMKIRGFKGDELIGTLELFTKNQRWISVLVSSIEPPLGVEVTSENVTPSQIRLTFRTHFAGTFRGLHVVMEVRDILGLFARPVDTVFTDFVIESLPSSLLIPIPKPKPFLLALGERTAGTKGAGQEFYAIDEYTPSSETRDVLWKRVARMPQEMLLVRIRESNMPQRVTVGVLEIKERAPLERLRFVDLMSEGIGLLGRNVMASKCDVTILANFADHGLQESGVTTPEELADSLLRVSQSSRIMEDYETVRILNSSDILITGLLELEDMNLAIGVSRKPTLLIDEEANPVQIGEQSLIFRGTEDIRRLIARAVEK